LATITTAHFLRFTFTGRNEEDGIMRNAYMQKKERNEEDGINSECLIANARRPVMIDRSERD
jgi:hypothetical protein